MYFQDKNLIFKSPFQIAEERIRRPDTVLLFQAYIPKELEKNQMRTSGKSKLKFYITNVIQ
ncbi:hypothetical protein DLM78_11660 [Leptospira stimsonii]|uniref:Uncharacterized protein n=1 Tax=Leptospira stimsonii TaxID=2202203 RepID=A0A8B3CTY3_9LEPT|nr:hypothetical protein DLM78_11660 [Leptospira stimsonii]